MSNVDTQLHYIYFSVLSHAYNIVIDRGVVAHGHGKYVADGLNATNFSFLNVD